MLAVASSHVVAGVVTWLHTDEEWAASAIDQARELAARPMRHKGTRNTPVRFLSGVRLTIPTPYLTEDRSKRHATFPGAALDSPRASRYRSSQRKSTAPNSAS